ncbi:MAG: cobaltochelatase subunit CobN, partial [Nitrososphaerota archaeon]|nr:cobaltochelatase subunit CobN [Nitrososphaerota archaeon]
MSPLKVAYLTTTPTDAVPLISAVEALNKKFGEIVKVKLVTLLPQLVATPTDDFTEFAKQSHLTIIHVGHDGDINQFVSIVKNANVPLFIGASFFVENKKYSDDSTIEPEDYQKIFRYINNSGQKNFENLLLYLSNRFIGTSYEVAVSEPQQWEGIYHPDFTGSPKLAEYLQKKYVPEKPTVGIWFHHANWQSQDISFIDSLVKEIERQGANALPVFFHGSKNAELGIHGFDWLVDNYFFKDGKPLVDVVISTLAMNPLTLSSSGSEGLDALKKLNVTVIKAILTVNTFETWRDTVQGLNVVDIPSSVAFPEFDGFLITVPIGTMSFSQINSLTGTRVIHYEPIPERINKVVRLALNWTKLHYIPNSEKKVAIIFHNYPPRNDTIGKAFAIDTAVSVLNLLHNMKAQGYTLDSIPKEGKELMDIIINGLTNDRRWLSTDELAKRAVDKFTPIQYTEWFSKLPLAIQTQMEKQWGKLPGKVFSHNGNMLISGFKTGNIYIGLQPPRGFLDDPASIYHCPDLPPPYHYIAYYTWVRNVFQADAIIHVGTHGSLEWLPGKSVGLSEFCYSDIAISDLPNIYPYVITNPGEGTQAKRRSYCCIIDYLIPVMHNADTYEELAQLEVQLQEFYSAKAAADKGKLSILQKLIWSKIVEAKLDKDLLISEADAFIDFDKFLERLHAYLHELSDSQIRDGLHILGEPPTGIRLEEFLVTLTRLRNGAIPSLRQSIAEIKGYDYEELLTHKGRLRQGEGRTNGDVVSEINLLAFEIMKKFNAADFTQDSVDIIANDVLGKNSFNVKKCLTWVSSFLVPALAKTTDELTNILKSCDGNYIPPGP